MNFEYALSKLKAGLKVGMINWGDDVFLSIQFPDEYSKMTAPYIYVTSRFGKVPWVVTQIEILSLEWRHID